MIKLRLPPKDWRQGKVQRKGSIWGGQA